MSEHGVVIAMCQGTKLLVVVLSWASLVFCHQGSLRAKPEYKWLVISISLCGKVGLHLVRSLMCPFGRREMVF